MGCRRSVLDKYERFRNICKEKLPSIIEDIGGRNIVVWGASMGGEIVKEEIENLGCTVQRFIDGKYSEKKEFLGLKVGNPVEVNKEEDYIIAGIMSFSYELEPKLWEMGYTHKDYRYIFDNEGYNKEDIIYRGCKIGRYTYGYEYLMEYYPFAKEIEDFVLLTEQRRFGTIIH